MSYQMRSYKLENDFIPAIEKSSTDQIEKFQLQELKTTLEYLLNYSAFYKEKFSIQELNLHSLNSLKDLSKFPVTTKEEISGKESQLLCVPPSEIIEYVTTSGTVGDPLSVLLSKQDVERLAYNEAISIACIHHQPGMKYQLMTTVDKRFMAGLAYTLGVHKLGGGLIRVGPGVPELQWDSIVRFQPDVLITVPSFLIKLIDYAVTNGIDLHNISVKKAICIGEPIRNSDFTVNTLGSSITSKWNIQLYSTYASTEMATAFTECSAMRGGHLHPELIYVELLDEDGNYVEEGEYGEVTITTLGVEAMPLFRFRTGDICKLESGACSCGRNTSRLSPLVGRKKHMLKIKGTTIFPATVYDMLNQIHEVNAYQLHVSSDEFGNDKLVVRIGLKEESEATEVIRRIREKCKSSLRVTPEIVVVNTHVLNSLIYKDSQRKPILFVDDRAYN